MSAGQGGRPIRCIETGRVFDYGLIAMQWVKSLGFNGRSASHIYDVCKGKKLSAYGYHWEYAT
jgi:hypothetical protein